MRFFELVSCCGVRATVLSPKPTIAYSSTLYEGERTALVAQPPPPPPPPLSYRRRRRTKRRRLSEEADWKPSLLSIAEDDDENDSSRSEQMVRRSDADALPYCDKSTEDDYGMRAQRVKPITK